MTRQIMKSKRGCCGQKLSIEYLTLHLFIIMNKTHLFRHDKRMQ